VLGQLGRQVEDQRALGLGVVQRLSASGPADTEAAAVAAASVARDGDLEWLVE